MDNRKHGKPYLEELCSKYGIEYKEGDKQFDERIFNVHKPDCDTVRNVRWDYCRNELLYAHSQILFGVFVDWNDLPEHFTGKPEDREFLLKLLNQPNFGLVSEFIFWMLSCFNDDKKEQQLKDFRQAVDDYCDNRTDENFKQAFGKYLVSVYD